MNEVAVIGFAHGTDDLVPVFEAALTDAGLGRREIGFWCSGSSDYLAGRAFSFVSAVDAIGAVPPISESHVEMDAAWALYEAYLKILAGEADTALVYGRSFFMVRAHVAGACWICRTRAGLEACRRRRDQNRRGAAGQPLRRGALPTRSARPGCCGSPKPPCR